jgi:negative regulator of sigma E activity
MSPQVDDPRSLLSALLDGELAPDEAAEVRAWVQEHPDGARELDELAQVRTALRTLPAVDPPFGFYERMLLDGSIESIETPDAPATDDATDTDTPGTNAPVEDELATRRRRRRWPGLAGAGAAVAAALALVLGVTPVTDHIVPPVNAFAARHDDMTKSPPSATAAPASSTTTSAPATTVATVTSPTSSSSTSSSTSSGDYHAIAADRLDSMTPPYVAPAHLDDYDRASAYATDGVVHVMYHHDANWLSVYEQPGSVDWGNMPADGHPMTVADDQAWETTVGRQAVLVIDHDGMVLTVVSAAPADEMMRAATSVPTPPAPTMSTRVQRGANNLVRSFGLG